MITKTRLTPAKLDILHFLYTYRYLRRDQIQTLLGGAGRSNTNHRLSQLADDGFLEGYYEPATLHKKPAVYYASLEAVRFYKTQSYTSEPAITRLYRSNRRTKAYIDRCLLAADIAIGLSSRATSLVRYDIGTSSAYLSPRSRLNFLVDAGATPDLVVVRNFNADNYPFVVEIVPPGPAYVVRNKIKTYLALQQDGDWEDHLGLDAPTIIMACTSYTQLRTARVYVAQINRTNRSFKVELTTSAKAVTAVTKLLA